MLLGVGAPVIGVKTNMDGKILRTHQIREKRMSSVEVVDAIGVVIVTYNSSDVIENCLDSLIGSNHPNLRVVIIDNNSPDDTVEVIRRWANDRACNFAEAAVGETPPPQLDIFPSVTLLRSNLNKGFAAGTNIGLRTLLAHVKINLFWLLNPDCVAMKDTARVYAQAAAAGPFSLMGGRTLYLDPPNQIQSDGGRFNRWTGLCHNVNQGLSPDTVPAPDSNSLDYISGANVVASRTFIEAAGLMVEDYFLYYEEVEWATRRGKLSLKFCPEAVVYHHGGTAIGSGLVGRRASGFANYFNYRNRMIFMRRNFPAARPTAYLYSVLKIAKLVLLGAWQEAFGAFCGLHQLAPPRDIRTRLAPEAAALAFGKKPEPNND
jgi:GT2 family glycosyltransferase